MSVQQISRGCAIPIAVAYRRVAKLEEYGLVKCVGYEEVYRGKKVNYYQCAVNMAKVIFAGGKFDVEVDFLPESEMEHIGPNEAEGENA
ncbi:MAG: helix-turn-helix transcriptional regulator [Methanomassiliicoccus sp.]|nr:helix-turn-helix transcriptional regulator [Methanomassiliicoccus sp.]